MVFARLRRPRLRGAALAAVALTGTAVLPTAAADAAAKKPASLKATTVSTKSGSVAPGQRIRVRGAVRNTGGRSSAAILEFKLRSAGRPKITYPLGGGRISSVKAGRTRKFSVVTAMDPTLLTQKVDAGFHLVVCVRRTRGDSIVRCRKASKKLQVFPSGVAAGQGGTTTTVPGPTTTVPGPTTTVTQPAPTPTPTSTDTTAPTTTDDVPGAYSATPVRVTLTAADEGGSGVAKTYFTTGPDPAAPTTSSAVYNAESKPQLNDGDRIRYFSVDAAGNPEAAHVSNPAKVDTAAPVSADDVPTTYRNVPVTVTLSAADVGGSGVDRIYFTKGASPAEPTTFSAVYDPASKPVLADGETIRYRAADVAGNLEATRSSTAAKVDTVVPVTTDDVPSTLQNGPFAVTLSATDGGGSGDLVTYYTTGVAPSAPTAFSSRYDPADKPVLIDGEKIRYLTVDGAGNAETVKTSGALRVVSGTIPVTADDVPTAWQNTPVLVTLSRAGSGTLTTYYTTGTTPAEPTTSSSVYDPANRPTLGNGERIRYFTVDDQGRTEAAHSSDPANVETIAPTTTDDVPATYRNTPIRVTLSATDTGGSGVARIYFTLGQFPEDPTTASSVYDPGNKPVLVDGETVKYRAVDAAGNLEAVKTSGIARIETIPPYTFDDVPSDLQSAPVAVTLDAFDEGGSGVDRTYFTTGAAPAVPTTQSAVYDPAAKPVLGDGERIRYFSVDRAGNAERPSTSPAVQLDTATYVQGAQTLNDTLFPDIGGGGYDVQHYDMDLDYVISSKALSGTTTVYLTTTQNLSRFTLDFAPWLRVSRITIDGTPVTFGQAAQQDASPTTDYNLDITPVAPGIRAGETVAVAITYAGITQPVIDPDGAQDGWIPDTTFGAIAVSEPIGAMGWFPNNNVPFDKATSTIAMTVPDDPVAGLQKPWSVVGTGVLESATAAGGKRRYVWENADPTAPYLLSVSIGRFDLATTMTPVTASSPTSVPFTTAIDSNFLPTAKTTQLADLGRTPAINDYYSEYYGLPYPFTSQGGINPMQYVGYSLETQGKPTYAVALTGPASTGAGVPTISHENGHMFFGDYVTLTQWKDIWLNEGMTEFSSWLWQANRNSGTTLAARFTGTYNVTTNDFWLIPPATPPTGADIFDNNAMYRRGATTMTAINLILGDARFRDLMHTYLTDPRHEYGNATTEQFIALVKQKDPTRAARWDAFFTQWLYTSYPGTPSETNKPQITPSNF